MSARRRARLRRTTIVAVLLVALIASAMWFTRGRGADIVARTGCQIMAVGGPLDYEPDQVENAATIAAVGMSRRLPDRAVTIALATAMQESALHNLDYGDRDSLGLFQQRPSQGWGTPQQVREPVYASTQFYARLVQVAGWQSMPLTRAAQRVQRSGFPDAYAQHEDEAAAMTAAFSGQKTEAVTCLLDPATKASAASAVGQELRRELGARASVEGTSRLRVTAASERQAWVIGAWAVAHAERHGTNAVSVGSRGWQRGRDARAARWESVDGSRDTVVISLATAP